MQEITSVDQATSFQLEEQFIGQLLKDPESIPEFLVPKVKNDFFRDPRHRKLFQVIARHWPRRVTLIELSEELANNQELADVGGRNYIDHLQETASIWDPNELLRLLEGRAAQVQAEELAADIKHIARRNATSPIDTLSGIQERYTRFIVSLNGTTQRHVSGETIYQHFLDERERVQFSDEGLGLPTGIPALDEMAGGLHPGSLTVLAGLPGYGKTLVMLSMMRRQLLKHRLRVGYISLEMDEEDIAARHLMGEAQVGFRELYREGQRNEIIKAAATKLQNIGERALYAFDLMYIEDIYLTVWEWHLKHKVDVVYVDHLQQIETKRRVPAYWERVAYIADMLKRCAKETRVPLFVASQFTRAASGKDSHLEDGNYGFVKGGTRIEEVADRVMYLTGSKDTIGRADRATCSIAIAKNRRGKRGAVAVEIDFHSQDVVTEKHKTVIDWSLPKSKKVADKIPF